MELLTSADLNGGAILPYEDVALPMLGPDRGARVRCLTGLELDRYEIGFWVTDPVTKKPAYSGEGSRGRLLAMACVDAEGQPVGNAAYWIAYRADVVDRLFDVAQQLSGLNATVEDLKKAFGAAQAGASPTT